MKKTKMLFTTILLIASTWLAKSQGFKGLQIPCTVKAPICDTTTLDNCEYICNGGFETYSTTIWAPSQLPWANGWTSPTWGTPDLFCTTSTVAAVQIPCNGLGYQASRTGTNSQVYAGIYTSGDAGNPYAEYLQTELKWGVNPGELYEISFWISRADFQPTDNDRLDVFLTSSVNCINGGTGNPPSFEYANTYTAGSAPTPIYNVPTASLNDATNWVEVKFIYCADGTEYKFIIGSYSGTSTINVTPPTSVSGCNLTSASTDPNSQYYSYGPAYLYVDDISMKRITSTVAFSPDNRCVGTPVNFTITPITCFTPPSNYYIWDYGDGTTPAAGNLTATHSYTAAGVYTVTVSYNIPNAIGCTPTHTMVVTVLNCCYNNNANNITLHNANLVANGTSGATAWTSMTAGNTYTGNIAVPLGTIVTNTLTVIGSMTISTPITFSLCNIAINEDVPIYQNSLTYFERCWLWGCDKLWEGIVSTERIEAYDSFIEDAYAAIHVNNGGTHPGLICDNVVFGKNYYGIVGTGTIAPSDFKITGCVFVCRTISNSLHNFSYPPPRYSATLAPLNSKVPTRIKASTAHSIVVNTIRSNYGIWLALLSPTSGEIAIGETNATPSVNASYTNYFDYLNCGIYNLWSKVFIKNNSFGNMVNTGLGTAIGGVVHDDSPFFSIDRVTSTKIGDAVAGSNYKNIFNIMKDGVAATKGGTLTISGNDFKTVSRYGVSVTNWYSSSTVTPEPVTVAINSYTDCLYPFYAYDNNYIKCSVSQNTVTHVQPTYTAGYCVHINEINKPANATYSITANKYSGMLYGIDVLNTSGARIVSNTVTIKKPGTGVFNFDIFLNNTDNSIVSDNILDCNPTNSNSWNTYGVLGSTAASNTIQCNTMTKVGSCIKFQGSGSPNYIHNNSLNNNPSDPCLFGVMLDNGANIGDIGHWNSTSSIWERSDDIWGDFLYGGSNNGADTWVQGTNPNYSAGGNIHYDNGALAALYTPSVNLFAIGNTPFSAVSNGNTNGNGCGIGARMATSGNGGKSVSTNETVNPYLAKKRVILHNSGANSRENNGNDDSFFMVDSLFIRFKGGDSTALVTAQNINAGISAQNNIEQNQKDFNAIYAALLNDKNSVSGSQVQDIVNMAKLCPFTDGFAVYQSRALVRNWDDSTFYFNECEIRVPTQEEHARNAMKALEENPSAIIADLFPNPANNNLTVKTNLNNVVLEVYDVVGRRVLSQKLMENETKIDVTSFNNGTYLYKITNSTNKVIKNGKIVINH